MVDTLGVWLAAVATIAMISYVYGENPLFKFFEHIFIGMAAAHAVVMGYFNVIDKGIKPIIEGKWWLIVPCILGLLLYARFTKNWYWLSRIPLGLTMGIGAALSIRGEIEANFVEQILTTMLPLTSLNNVLFVAGVVTTIMYFLYLRQSEKSSFLKGGGEIGRMVMMMAFGASFGFTVMARMSLLIGRLQFLFGEWIPLIK